MSNTIVTGTVRISYEHLLKPYANQPGQDEKYSCTMLIPKTDVATKAAIDAAIQESINEGVSSKWNGTRPAQPPTPLWDGDGVRQNGEAFGPECKGCWVMTASSKKQPEVVDQNVQPILSASEIYSGMYARVSLRFFAYSNAGRKGIGCGLGNVQKIQDGEPLGGGTTAVEDFGAPAAPAAPAQPTTYPAYAQQAPAYSAYPQQAAYQQPAPAVDPITGLPL